MLIGIAFSNLSYGQNRQIEFANGSWSEIVQQAKDEKKPIFVDAYAVWCGPCKWMSATVFTNDTVADFYNATFINVKIDMEKGEGIELAKKWQIKAYPTLLYFDETGELIHQVCGAFRSGDFVNKGEEALDPSKQIKFYQTKYQAGERSHTFVREYIDKMGEACMNSSEVLNSFLDAQNPADLVLRENWNLMQHFLEEYNSKSFKYLEENQQKFIDLYGENAVNEKLNAIYGRYLNQPLYVRDLQLFEKRKAELEVKNSSLINQLIDKSSITRAELEKDWKKYVATADQYIKKYEVNNWMHLNGFAWTAYEKITDKKLLKKAVIWIEKSISIEENTYNLDTYAHLLEAVGNTKKAIVTQEKVVKIAEEQGDDQLAEFQDYLKHLQSK